MMTPKDAAARLNGNEYGEEGSKALFEEMKASGLVAVFGASDDLMEFRGAVYDEAGCYGGGTAYFTEDGLYEARCKDDNCPHEELIRENSDAVLAEWCVEDGGPSWTYSTDIPHETFEIMEDGEVYCRGIVFALADVI